MAQVISLKVLMENPPLARILAEAETARLSQTGWGECFVSWEKGEPPAVLLEFGVHFPKSGVSLKGLTLEEVKNLLKEKKRIDLEVKEKNDLQKGDPTMLGLLRLRKLAGESNCSLQLTRREASLDVLGRFGRLAEIPVRDYGGKKIDLPDEFFRGELVRAQALEQIAERLSEEGHHVTVGTHYGKFNLHVAGEAISGQTQSELEDNILLFQEKNKKRSVEVKRVLGLVRGGATPKRIEQMIFEYSRYHEAMLPGKKLVWSVGGEVVPDDVMKLVQSAK